MEKDRGRLLAITIDIMAGLGIAASAIHFLAS